MMETEITSADGRAILIQRNLNFEHCSGRLIDAVFWKGITYKGEKRTTHPERPVLTPIFAANCVIVPEELPRIRY